MQIYGIYVLYCIIQICLELNWSTIIYGEKYWGFLGGFCGFFVGFFSFLTISFGSNVDSDVIFAEK